MKLKNIILIFILTIFINLPVFAKHSDVIILSCSEITKQDIYYIQHMMEIQKYQLPLTITCDVKGAEDLFNRNPIPTINFNDVNGLSIISASEVYDVIFVRENPTNMTYSRALVHELGHYNHVLKVGYNKFEEYRTSPVPEEMKPIIVKNMRKYATFSKEEFVAEYFAYTQLGYKLPKELTKLYKSYGGP